MKWNATGLNFSSSIAKLDFPLPLVLSSQDQFLVLCFSFSFILLTRNHTRPGLVDDRSSALKLYIC
jgi:hypothetical protein